MKISKHQISKMSFRIGILVAVFGSFLSGAERAMAGEVDLPPAFQAQYRFEIKPETGTVGELNQPAGISIDPLGNIYVADTVNSRVVVFNKSGKTVRAFGEFGEGASQLSMPMALAVDSKAGRIYVADSGNHRVQVFKTDGTFILSIDLGQAISAEERPVRPIGIAVNSKGTVYVSDADNHLIRAYSPEGKFLFKFGGPGTGDGQLYLPVGLCVDAQDRLYVVDMNNARLQVFDQKGGFLSKFGDLGDTKGAFFKPKTVTVDEKGLIYISDAGNLVVQVFDQKGELKHVIGTEKNVESQFAAPFGLAVSDRRLYVTDRWRNSIRVYEIEQS